MGHPIPLIMFIMSAFFGYFHSVAGNSHNMLNITENSHNTQDRQVKGKAVPLYAWRGPEGSRSLRHPDFQTIGKWRW